MLFQTAGSGLRLSTNYDGLDDLTYVDPNRDAKGEFDSESENGPSSSIDSDIIDQDKITSGGLFLTIGKRSEVPNKIK